MGINLSQKKGKIRLGPELCLETLGEIDDTEMTRRVLVSHFYAINDTMGMMAPLTIKYKLLLQKFSNEAGWDDHMEEELADSTRKILKEVVLVRDINFPWSVKPAGILPGLELVCWRDGGDPASAGCIYGRYKLEEKWKEGYTPSSTSKGGSQLRKSTPRTELRGLLILCRLVTAVLPGLTKMPTRISLMGDSKCTISAVECDSKLLEVWFRNRVAEILDHMEDCRKQGAEVDELYHWPGDRNPADIATKGKATVDNVSETSDWQLGPEESRYHRETCFQGFHQFGS